MRAAMLTQPEALALRPARRSDAPDLARLVDLAGEGLPAHYWAGLAGPGEDALAVGVRRAARDAGAFSWRNAVVAEVGGRVAGAVIAYEIAAAEPLDGVPPLFRPLQALENRAVGTTYVNVLAVYPAFRRRGVARALLDAACAAGTAGASLIVADANVPARRLYEARGFNEAAREPVVREGGWTSDSADWVLMLAPAPRRV